MDYGIFNVRTYINAYDCARGCTVTVRESALKFDSGRKIPCRTRESHLRQRRAGPALSQLRCIPIIIIITIIITGLYEHVFSKADPNLALSKDRVSH